MDLLFVAWIYKLVPEGPLSMFQGLSLHKDGGVSYNCIQVKYYYELWLWPAT